MTNFASNNTPQDSDAEFIIAVIQYMVDVWNIPRMSTSMTSGMTRIDNKLYFDPATGRYHTIQYKAYTRMLRPDIIVWQDCKVRAVIELDGKPPEFGGSKSKKNASYHDTPSGQRHDCKRDRTYLDAGIPLIRYSASEANLMGWRWQKVIDTQMRMLLCKEEGHKKSQHAGDQCVRCGKVC